MMEDQEAPEQSSPLPSPSQPNNQKSCRYCRQDIHIDAKVCQHCRYHQDRRVQFFPNIQSVGLILTLVALGISGSHLMEAQKQRISASEARAEAMSAKESATKSVRRVEAVAVQVQAAEREIEGLLAQAQTIEQHLLEIEERQILRIWVNVLPNGEELLNPISGGKLERGVIRQSIGPGWDKDPPFTSVPGPKWEWTCDDKTIRQLSALIQEFPYVPYAYVARADCFKKRGVSSWQADAEQAQKLLEKMMTMKPHPGEIESFYKLCLSLFSS